MAKKDYYTDINKWLSLCKLSEEERKTKQPKWDQIDKYFRGWQWDAFKTNDRDIVTVNLVYSHVKIVVPSTYLRYPKVYFTPQSPAAIDGCILLEQVLNADMRKMKLKETNKRVLQDVILYGTGFTKTTFEIEGDIPETQEDRSTSEQMIDEFHDTPNASAISNQIRVPKASPRCFRISPRDIMFCVSITDFGDPGFIAHRSRVRLQKIKNDPYYNNTKDLQPTSRIKSEYLGTSGFNFGPGSEKYLDTVDLYEIWDVDEQKWFTIADGHAKYLTDVKDNPYPVDHPFDRLIMTPLEDQVWGFGEIEPWLPQQDELNSIRSQQSKHRKRYNRKYGTLANAFETEEEEAKLTSGEDGVVIKFRANRPINEQIQPINDAPMPADVYRMNLIIEDDIVKIGRVTPNRRGNTTGDTATEANLAEAGASIGDKDRVDAVADFTLSQLEKVRKMRRALTIGREIIDTTGNPLDENRWQYWTREDIDVESMMSIEFGSTQPQNDQQRQQRGLLLYQQALANPTVNPQSAFSKLLEAFSERDQPSWFLPNEIIQLQMIMKAIGQSKEQKGISPLGQIGSGEPGPVQTTETPAELAGRGAPISRVGNG